MFPVGITIVMAFVVVCLLAPPARASSTFTVDSIDDTGDADPDGVCGSCTLREAIQEANSNANPAEVDRIDFDISGTGVHTISPTSALPAITQPAIIDGYSQPGASPNTRTVGDDAVLKIVLDGIGVSGNGLQISDASDSVIRGLVVKRFSLAGIVVSGGSARNLIQGNFVGTSRSGTLDRGNGGDGVVLSANTSGTVVGGSTPEKRNVISANGDTGISLDGAGASFVKGNYVGTDASGTRDLGNDDTGINISGASGTTIGGKTAASRNLLSGNAGSGLAFAGRQGKVFGNRIGTTVDGKAALGNDLHGVSIRGGASGNLLGDGTPGGSNTIAFNGLDGVDVDDSCTGNEISHNSVFSNGGLGIDLRGAGEGFNTDFSNPNDPGDADFAANNLQNNPLISSATTASGVTTVQGTLEGIAGESFTIEFYSNPAGTNEGKKFIGEVVSDSEDGTRSFTFSPATSVPVGRTITATATRDLTHDTSEFSAPKAVASS